MNENAVRAAVERITFEAHGLFMGTGEECRMVPVAAIQQLVNAVDAEPDPAPGPKAPQLDVVDDDAGRSSSPAVSSDRSAAAS